MTTASWQFLAFSAVVAAVWSLRSERIWRDCVVLLANLAFLASLSSNPRTYIPYGVFLLLGYCAVKVSGRRRSGRTLSVMLTVLVLGFCWLKKYWFLAGLGFLSVTYVTIGLSYVFFRVLHLVIDAKDDPQVAAISPLSYINYTLNFASLVAGPIQRYQDFSKPVPPLDLASAGRSLERIAQGLFKVLVLAEVLAAFHDDATARLLAGEGSAAHLAAIGAISIAAYPIYLYFNFSGYVDIVIGVARFIGLILPENFNRPFAAVNFMDFWARYHMTLSNWLKDYVYTPFLRVLMTRYPDPSFDPLLGTLAFFVTFFLIGIWHGSSQMFAIYGLLLAAGISANKLYQTLLVARMGRKSYRALTARPAYRALSMGLTFMWYALSMICFWASDDQAMRLLQVLGFSGTLFASVLLLVVAAPALFALDSLQQAATTIKWGGAPLLTSRYVRTAWATVLIFLCGVASLTQSAGPDIVYKAF